MTWRRTFLSLAALVTVASLAACSPATSDSPPGSTSSAGPSSSPFAALENRDSARLGVAALDLSSGATQSHRADERFAFCSTFKVYAVGAVLAAVDAGRLSLSDNRIVTAEDKVPGSAVDWPDNSTVTLADLAAAALTKSDNTSGNLLIREAGGTAALTSFAHSLGDIEFRLDRTEPELNTAIPGDPRDTTTPASLVAGYRTLLDGEVLSAPSRGRLLAWMENTETSAARFRAGIPTGWTSADKTGTGSYGVSNDAGLLLGPDGRRIVLVVLTTTTTGDENGSAMNELVADTTRLVVEGT
ncbi:class A beta-lactamase [Actinomycetes bacterium M1A6_2h]